jgi:hypothetical protein
MADIDKLAYAVKAAAIEYVKHWKALRSDPTDEQRPLILGRLDQAKNSLRAAVEALLR